MRILFAAPYVPSPSRFRAYQLVDHLSRLGHRITVVALGVDGTDADQSSRALLEEICEAVHIVPVSRGGALLQTARLINSPVPLWVASSYSPLFLNTLRHVLACGTFDVAHLESLRMAHAAGTLKHAVPVVFDAVDCRTDIQARHAKNTSNTLDRAVARRELEKMERYEPRVAAECDRVLAATDHSANCLNELAQLQGASLKLDVIANGVDLSYFQPQPEIPVQFGKMVFSGQMDNEANRDAASYFCEEIMPGIRNAYPPATITFVGSNPAPELTALASDPHSGVHATGRVADARPFFAHAALAVCPLRSPGASRNRVLQLMAMGKALVASPTACHALRSDAVSESVLTADTPLAFATQIIHLLKHPEEADRLGRNARRYVEDHHDWRKIALKLTDIYDEVIEERKRSGQVRVGLD
ncbi:MAG: group 1 glycosyl transferase [Capsulimonas sp.]|jgi:glycosyltransferase involved in cell wall biosynthesis|nr:group 1 glycosyl transferase [Capsulimonas sp.]